MAINSVFKAILLLFRSRGTIVSKSYFAYTKNIKLLFERIDII